MRRKKPRQNGFDVFVKTNLYNFRKQKVGETWTVRTNGRATTDLEMAEALTHDLSSMGVTWQIRDQDGTVIQASEKETIASSI